MHQLKSPQEFCVHAIEAERQDNLDHQIWPSHVKVANVMLARRLELADVFCELHKKLYDRPKALRELFFVVFGSVAQCNEDSTAQARQARNELVEINRKIASCAADLSSLVARRTVLHNTSGFTSNTFFSVLDLVREAGSQASLFSNDGVKQLDVLRARYDLKYWPTISDVLSTLGQDADEASCEATDLLTEASTDSSRPSLADFFRALILAIEEACDESYGIFPIGFSVSDAGIASLGNVALDLGPDDLVDGAYIKRLRQRMREG